MSIVVQLERFEGPLGLLLHLIREQEMDVFNINVNQITRQYLEYIKTMRRLDLEVAGEFVAMAATLIHLKSRMLLPQYNEEGAEVTEDPRKELVQKLVEYKKYQELSGQLYQRPLLGRDVLTRGERTKVEPVDEGELVLTENPLFSLIAAYRFACKSMKKGVHTVASELQSIAARILEMRELLVVGKRLLFRDLLDKNAGSKSNHVLVTFLSLLELAKMGFVAVFQAEPLADIHIESKRTVDRDVVSNVESYDSVNAAMVVDEIFSEAQLTLNEPTDEDDERAPEEPGIGREAFTDAASDDDIAAEERRLFSEEGVFEPAASEAVESEIAAGAADLNVDLTAADPAPVTLHLVPEHAPQPQPEPQPEPEEPAANPASADASKRNVDSALAAALDAFNAFGDEPAAPAPKDPEVDS